MNNFLVALFVCLAITGCADTRRILIVDGQVDTGNLLSAGMQGRGCYVKTTTEPPKACVSLITDNCRITIGECAEPDPE